MSNRVIMVQDVPITISTNEIADYICITDIAGAKSEQSRAADVIRNWLRNRTTLEFLATWEEIYNPNFKVFEFDVLEELLPIRILPLNLLLQSVRFLNYI